jgi:hypothetical protein
VCPGITVDALLARHPAWAARIYLVVVNPRRRLGSIHEDAVNVGIFIKSDRMIAEFPHAYGRSSCLSTCRSELMILESPALSRPPETESCT